ncbi:MAG: NAD(P)/FAD-dependent oxidoreductase [Bacillota bacterium]
MEHAKVLIIGAGVVGLAVAAELAGRSGRDGITLMERHNRFGLEISSRNSEVIHAGIYYPAGSLKAALCVEGNRLLYRFCEHWAIPCRRLSKLIVAREESEIGALERLYAQGRSNGVDDLALLDAARVAVLEPHVSARAALLSPSTGIVDSHRLMQRLAGLAAQGGVMAAYCHEVVAVEPAGGGFRVRYRNPDGSLDCMLCDWLINSAGLGADRIAAWTGIDLDTAGYRIHPCKGDYFSVSQGKAKYIERLIYPPPLDELKGLGVHATKSLDGRLRLGPDAAYVEDLDYRVDPAKAGRFYEAVRSYLPFIEPADLEPESAGIRPKLQGPGEPFRDFVVRHEESRGLPGLINLIGIESPGLTCCLSLARLVADLLQ